MAATPSLDRAYALQPDRPQQTSEFLSTVAGQARRMLANKWSFFRKCNLGGAWLRLEGRNLVADRRGVSAVEFAMVAPILITILTGVIDFGYLFTAQNNMTSVSQETARLVAVGEMTAAQGKTYAGERLLLPSSEYTVSVTSVGSDVVVDIDLPYKNVVLVDVLGLFESGGLSIQSKMRVL